MRLNLYLRTKRTPRIPKNFSNSLPQSNYIDLVRSATAPALIGGINLFIKTI